MEQPLALEYFAFGDLKMHNFRPFYSLNFNFGELKMVYLRPFLGLISKYDFWGVMISFPRNFCNLRPKHA